jgi:hypothetical protein
MLPSKKNDKIENMYFCITDVNKNGIAIVNKMDEDHLAISLSFLAEYL